MQLLKGYLDDISEQFERPPIIEANDPDIEELSAKRDALVSKIHASEGEEKFNTYITNFVDTVNTFFQGSLVVVVATSGNLNNIIIIPHRARG